MGVKERKERQKTEMREAILSAALKLFSDEGYDNVTMRKIADKIEYSVGTIYLYFKDKGEIFYELHNRGFAEFYKRQLSVQHIKDPIERLKAHGEAYIQFAMEYPEYYDVMFISRTPAKEIKKSEHWEEGERTYEILKLNIKQAMEAGYFKDVDLEVAAFSLWSFVHGISALFVRERLSMLPTEFLKPLINRALEFLSRAY
ncbi:MULTISPECIES: TetR/AcrR family transcriptional regulator [Ignavibacterium]|jgi:AcrR family transcriptional regulator|uniref:TetR/AcrR family transcriptional regulator n=1 Tax=Ignavibacterium TaxID=795750 RepID=UPI0025BD710A|nr:MULTISPECIES: TetR/AcrR family transcriptional regulator [Ignavibacterium]MBI5661729.1 TetR/AcrR family transcriptional regulator [Ignavibacterium album]